MATITGPARASLCALATLVAGTIAAGADDYPYSGRLTLTPPAITVPLAQLYCAYNFFVQGKDGRFTGYHLDLDRFRAGDGVSYVTYQKGTCSLDSVAPSVESCLMSFDTDPAMQGRTFIDSFRVLEDGAIGIVYFQSLDEARAFAAGGDATRQPDAQFVPCEDPGGRPVDTYLSDAPSTLSPQARAAITSPDLDDTNADTMLKVLDAIFAAQ